MTVTIKNPMLIVPLEVQRQAGFRPGVPVAFSACDGVITISQRPGPTASGKDASEEAGEDLGFYGPFKNASAVSAFLRDKARGATPMPVRKRR